MSIHDLLNQQLPRDTFFKYYNADSGVIKKGRHAFFIIDGEDVDDFYFLVDHVGKCVKQNISTKELTIYDTLEDAENSVDE